MHCAVYVRFDLRNQSRIMAHQNWTLSTPKNGSRSLFEQGRFPSIFEWLWIFFFDWFPCATTKYDYNNGCAIGHRKFSVLNMLVPSTHLVYFHIENSESAYEQCDHVEGGSNDCKTDFGSTKTECDRHKWSDSTVWRQSYVNQFTIVCGEPLDAYTVLFECCSTWKLEWKVTHNIVRRYR